MKCEFIELPERRIIGGTTRTSVGSISVCDDVPRLWREFYENGCSEGVPSADVGEYRFATVNHGYDKSTEQFNVTVGCFEARDGTGAGNHQGCVVPAGVYAKVTVDNADPESVSRAWREIYHDSQILSLCDFEIEIKAYHKADNGLDIFISTRPE